MAAISERLASLHTAVRPERAARRAGLATRPRRDDLDGLPDFARAAAAAGGKGARPRGRYAITLSRSSVEPFLTFSSRRDLRRTPRRPGPRAVRMRAPHDNPPLIREILALRAEQARLLGYDNFADYRLDDTMAKTAAAVERSACCRSGSRPSARPRTSARSWRRWPAPRASTGDRALGLALLRREGAAGQVRPRRGGGEAVFRARQHGAGGVRHRRPAVRPHLHRAQRISRSIIPMCGSRRCATATAGHVGLFLHDNFARPGKHSGAWMSSYRDQEIIDGEVAPIVVNNNNFAKGEPTLLSFDDAKTLFHEFGHGLHGLLSRVRYPSQSGTAVRRDFVEFPSQIFEHWMSVPETLRTLRPPLPRPASRYPRICCAGCSRRAISTRASPRWSTPPAALLDLDFHAQRRSGDPRLAGVRAGFPGPDGHAAGDRVAPSPGAFPASVRRRRLCRRLLRLSLGRGARRRRFRRLHRERRTSSIPTSRRGSRRFTAPATRATRWSSIAPFAAASRDRCAVAAARSRGRRCRVGGREMDRSKLMRFVDQCWGDEIVPTLVEYIRIPNKSPAFDPDWAAHGYMDEAVALFERWARRKARRRFRARRSRSSGCPGARRSS